MDRPMRSCERARRAGCVISVPQKAESLIITSFADVASCVQRIQVDKLGKSSSLESPRFESARYRPGR